MMLDYLFILNDAYLSVKPFESITLQYISQLNEFSKLLSLVLLKLMCQVVSLEYRIKKSLCYF